MLVPCGVNVTDSPLRNVSMYSVAQPIALFNHAHTRASSNILLLTNRGGRGSLRPEMRKFHAKVVGLFDRSFPTEGKVTIDRKAGLFTVRPKRRHRTFELPLGDVASFVVRSVIRAEVAAKKKSRPRVKRGFL